MQDVRWRFWWLLSGDGFHRVDNVPKPISAGALHRTQWGAYSAIQTPSWWGKGLPQEHYPSAHRATLPPPGNTPPRTWILVTALAMDLYCLVYRSVTTHCVARQHAPKTII